MNVRESAQEAISLLEKAGWNKGSAIGPDGSLCMASALGGVGVGYRTLDEMEHRWQQAFKHILRLFPGRLDPDSPVVADFNDHPDTTREDVLLVLKHMTEGELCPTTSTTTGGTWWRTRSCASPRTG